MRLDDHIAVAVQTAIELATAPLRARIAVLETRAAHTDAKPAARDGRDGVQGPAGPAGKTGEKGSPGLDGLDGTANIKAVQDPDDPRTVTLCFRDGTPIDGGVLRFDYPRFRDVKHIQWDPAITYRPGELVQAGGGGWLATAETTGEKPGAGQSAWTLFIKPGRDGERGRSGDPGKHGKAGEPGRPAVHPITGRGW